MHRLFVYSRTVFAGAGHPFLVDRETTGRLDGYQLRSRQLRHVLSSSEARSLQANRPAIIVFQVMQPIRNPSLYFTETEFERECDLELTSATSFNRYELNHRFTKAGRKALYLYQDIRDTSSYLADKVFDRAVRKDIKYMQRFFDAMKVPYLLHLNVQHYPFYKKKHIQWLRESFENILVYDIPVTLDYCREEGDDHPNGRRNHIISDEITRFIRENFRNLDFG